MGATRTWIDSVGYSGTGGGWFDITRGADYQAGDLFLVVIMSGRAITAGPPGWTLVPGSPWGTNYLHAYYKIAAASEPATYRVTFASNGGFASIATGWRATGPNQVNFDAYNVYPNGGSGTSIVAHSITTTVPDCTIVGFFGHMVGDIAIAPPGGMAEFRETPAIHLEACSYDVTGLVTTGDKTATAGGSVSNPIGALFAIYGGAAIDGDFKIEDSYSAAENALTDGIVPLSDSCLGVVIRKQNGSNWDFEAFVSTDKGQTWSKKCTIVSNVTSAAYRVSWIGDSCYVTNSSVSATNTAILIWRADYTPGTHAIAVAVNGATVRAAIVGTTFSLGSIDREPGGRLWMVYARTPTSDWTFVDASYSDDNGATWAVSTGLPGLLYGYPPTAEVHCLDKNTVVIIGHGGVSNCFCIYAYRLHTEAANTWHSSYFFYGDGNNVQGIVASAKLKTSPCKQLVAVMFEPTVQNVNVYSGRLVEAANAPYGLSVQYPCSTLWQWNTTGSEYVKALLEGCTDGYRLHYCYTGSPKVLRERRISLSNGVPWQAETTTYLAMLRTYDAWCTPRQFNTAYDSANTVLAYGSGYAGTYCPRARCALDTWGIVETTIARVFSTEVESLQSVGRAAVIPYESWQSTVFRVHVMEVENLRTVERRHAVPFQADPETTIALVKAFELETLIGVQRASSIRAEWTGALVLERVGDIPVEAGGGVGRDAVIETEALTGMGRSVSAEVEALAKTAAVKGVPVDYTGAIALTRGSDIPVEAGGGVGRSEVIPFEAAGVVVLTLVKTLQIETVGRLVSGKAMPIEASGIDPTEFMDTWNVRVKADDLFMDDWTVVPVVSQVEFEDSWNVLGARGMEFIDTWRVLPQQIVTLFGADIQVPSAEMEKS